VTKWKSNKVKKKGKLSFL